MTLKVTVTGDPLGNAMKAFKNLDKESVEVGHFASQGKHYSGYTYPELLQFWVSELAPVKQDVRAQFVFDHVRDGNILKIPEVKSALDKWAATPNRNQADNETLLDKIGRALRLKYQVEFNVLQGPHMIGTETPLYESGELAESTAYRTSISNKVKEG